MLQSGLGRQLRWAGRASGLSSDLFTPKGQMTGVGSEAKFNITSLGCVLDRHTVQWDGFTNARQTGMRMFGAWWSMQEVKRRRDDLEQEGLETLFKQYQTALATNDLSSLKDVLSVYEFSHVEERIKAEKKNRTLKEITDKPTAVVSVTKFTIVCYQQLEFEGTDYFQLNVRFQGNTTITSPLKGEKIEPFDTYVAFEVAQASHASNNVFSPLRIAGTYTHLGERIGVDHVDPGLYKQAMA
eukprot:TRINITY_DN25358_c0_g1_i1.p1 TRINITY_DN25358_c0_g1~~TRINITY_DN25358_c0_g1_i1.p1  ORF type:complete len:241 (+),score=48.90 TRINITY_DN25358_c0_g1_i1:37-759(+)